MIGPKTLFLVNMQDKTLMKIALICSLLGILLLSFISENIKAKETNISSISLADIDKDVKIIADVISAKQSSNTLFLNVQDDTGRINVVVFEPEDTVIKPGNKLEINGKVAIYNNKLEIIARTISIS